MVAVIYKNSDSHRLTEDIHLMIEYNNRDLFFSRKFSADDISVFWQWGIFTDATVKILVTSWISL